MNIFIIPSWYPSESNPIYGIFNKEQTTILAREKKDWSIGVSLWGQGDDRFLLWGFKPSSIRKIFMRYPDSTKQIEPNLSEYFSPAFIWTRKFLRGNTKGIIKANESNFKRYYREKGLPNVLWAQASYPAAIVVNYLSRKYQIPYLVSVHMSPFPFGEFLISRNELMPLIGNPLKEADSLIATSQFLKNKMESFGLSEINVLNNPVLPAFEPRENQDGNDLKMLTIGRIEDQKGIDILLKAISRLGRDFRGTVRIGGDGSMLNTYKRLSRNLKLEQKVKWLGLLSREEVLKEMQDCSFYILPSRHETFGIVLVEAMACGKAVVATRCGGPEEIVTEETGYLCKVEPEDLADKISLMIENFNSFDSEAIRKCAKKNYSSTVWVSNLEQLFKSLMSR